MEEAEENKKGKEKNKNKDMQNQSKNTFFPPKKNKIS
jgi:hypothetical protein